MISVIIPIYNVEPYLDQCLESVLAQEFEDFEVIGVDDCSPDNSAQIFKRYLVDSRFKLIANHENLGLPASRNAGLYQAQGSHVYFLDSDDWIAPTCLSLLHEVATRDSADIVIGGVLKYFEETGRLHAPKNHKALMDKTVMGDTIFDHPHIAQSIVSWNKLVRSHFLKSTGLLFKPSPRRFEDMLTYKWYLSGAKVSSIEQVTYFYRQRSQDFEMPSITQERGLLVINDKLLAFCDLCQFLVNKRIFGTSSDPLNSTHGTINLPRTLERLSINFLAKIEEIPQGETFSDNHIKCMFAFSTLFQILPASYIYTLSKDVQLIARSVAGRSVSRALELIKYQ